jgi:hypothetical protein
MIIAAIALLVIGVNVKFFGKNLGWIGHLPGDIHIEKDNFRFYFPITTLILLSVVFNLVIRVLKYLR